MLLLSTFVVNQINILICFIVPAQDTCSINVAIGCPATQSSQYQAFFGFLPGTAVDGNTNQVKKTVHICTIFVSDA